MSEIRTSLSQWIDHDDVRLYNTNMDEVFPSVVYRTDWKSTNSKYGGGSGKTPVGDVRNQDGEQIALLYQDFERLRFDMRLKTQSTSVLLDMDETLKQSLKPYTDEIGGLWGQSGGSTAFHEDCQEFCIEGGSGDDDNSTQPVSRADIWNVEVEFWRYIRRDGTPIRTIYENYYFNDNTKDGDYSKQFIVGEQPKQP